MNTTVAGKPLINILEICYKTKRPVLLVGSHGIGKSELMAQAAKAMGIGLIVRDLSLLEPPDLIGLPTIRDGRTVYAPPAFLPRDGKGLLVIEELNRADRIMRAPCLQLMTARTLNDYVLPAGWLPVACINPIDDGYDVDELDPALLSRFVRIYVKPNVTQWIEWAQVHGVHPDIISYVECDKTVFDSPDSNPRSWAYASDLLKTCDVEATPASIVRTILNGVIGDKRSAAFLAFRKQPDKPLEAQDVLARYASRRPVVLNWVKLARLDLLSATSAAVQKHLQPKGNFRTVKANAKQWSNLGRFLGDLPADLRAQATKMMSERGYDLPPIPASNEEVAA